MIQLKVEKIFKFFLIVLFLVFVFLLIASNNGYYEYELKEKRMLTDSAIVRFEEDVKNGNNIDINNYLDTSKKDYNNNFSNMGNKFSNIIEDVFSKSFKYIFKYINSKIED